MESPITCPPVDYHEHFCLVCDRVRPFLDGYCYGCGAHSPVGDPCDEDISQGDWDAEESPRQWLGDERSDIHALTYRGA